jgi:hypothetical protein
LDVLGKVPVALINGEETLILFGHVAHEGDFLAVSGVQIAEQLGGSVGYQEGLFYFDGHLNDGSGQVDKIFGNSGDLEGIEFYITQAAEELQVFNNQGTQTAASFIY